MITSRSHDFTESGIRKSTNFMMLEEHGVIIEGELSESFTDKPAIERAKFYQTIDLKR